MLKICTILTAETLVLFVSIIMQSGAENIGLEKLCSLLPSVNSVDKSTTIPDGFQPQCLLPGTSSCITAR